MSALRGRKAKQVCESKVSHPTKKAAQAAALALKKKTGGRVRVYHCNGRYGETHHWHITSGTRSRL